MITIFFSFEWTVDEMLRWEDNHSEIMELDPMLE